MAVAQADYPTFRPNKSRFDQATFKGRLRHFLDVVDPRTLFTSEKRLNDCLKLLEAFENNALPSGVTNKQLWEAQKVKQAIIHPDTGEKVFMPFRMSGFVPFGTPIVVGMLLPNPTLPKTVFWQWLNQSHNACVNYSNRNATKPTPVSRFAAGYVGAVSTAIGIALSLNVLISKANGFTPAMKSVVQRFVPFPAVACASVCNVVLMRNNELSEGIEVEDEHGNVVGTSKVAARKALEETALTRAFLPAPILVIPPVVMTLLEKTKFLQRNPRMHLPLNALVCTLAFGGALPVAIALFPQYSKIRRSKLEAGVQAGSTDEFLFYNKGL